MTFTYLISKLFGVPILKRSMQGMNVFMHITGKISEESLSFSHIPMNNDHNGTQGTSFKYTVTAVRMNSYDHSVTDGRSKSITLKTTN